MTRLNPAGFFQEARRRRVFHIAAIYIVGAFVALQVADLAFPGLSIPETAIRFIWIGAIVGFPFALFFGWRYDLIDGRILLTAAPDETSRPIGKADTVTLSAMSLVLLTIIAGLGVEIANTRVEGDTKTQSVEVLPNSIAVLPFANFDGAADKEFIADGITETLLHALAQLPDLQVTARTSSFHYKGQQKDIREIARQLGVSKILEGSVQFSGDRIRVVAQLIEASTGFHLWSQTYDDDMDNIFEVQDAIASNVAIAMHVTLTDDASLEDSANKPSLPAYLEYLKGLEQLHISSNASLPLAEKLFVDALELDPTFSEARRALVLCYYTMIDNGTIPREEGRARGAVIIKQLLEDNPDEDFANYMAKRFADPNDTDEPEQIVNLIEAIGRQPNDTVAYGLLSRLLGDAGRREEAIEWLHRALLIDPLDHLLHFNLGLQLSLSRDLQAANDAFQKVVDINPDWAGGRSALGWARWSLNDYAGMYEHNKEAFRLDPQDPELAITLASRLRVLGLVDESFKFLERAREIGADKGPVVDEYLIHTYGRDPAEALSLAESYLRREPSERGSGYGMSAGVFTNAAQKLGKSRYALEIFEEVSPGVTTEDFLPSTMNEFYVHFWATFLWAQDKTIEQVDSRLDHVVPAWDAVRPGWQRGHLYSIPVAVMRGDMEEAVRIASGVSDHQPFLLYLYRNMHPHVAVASETAAAERLAVVEGQVATGREAIEAYIKENE
jgi:TolB-like protein